MTRKTLNFTAQTPQNPWAAGIPAGYSKVAGSDNSAIIARATNVWELVGATTAMLRDDTVLIGRYRCAEVKIPSFSSTSLAGPALIDASGNGYCVQTSSSANNYRIFAVLAGQMQTTVLWTSTAATYSINAVIRFIYDDTDKKYRVYVNGTQVFATSSVEFSSSTYTPIYATALSRFGPLAEMSSEYTPAQSVTSINGGSTIAVGQVGVPSVLTGFTGAITSVATDKAGMTCSSIGGAVNAPTFTLSPWVEGGIYPVLPVSVTFTYTYSAESASGAQTVGVPAGYVKQTFSSPIIDDPKLLGKWFADAGHTVEGAVFYYQPFSDLVVYPDTDASVSVTGTFNGWLLPASGATAGKMYEWNFTVNASGEIVGIGGVSAIGVTTIGITESGITSAGLR